MDNINLDREISNTLKNCAGDLQAPDTLEARVKFAINTPAPRHQRKWFKRAVATIAVASLAVTGALAGSGVMSITSHSYHDKAWKDFSQTASYADKQDLDMKYVESFSNGYKFKEGNTQTSSKNDENGNSLGLYTAIDLFYEKDGKTLSVSAEPLQSDLSYMTPFDTVKTIGDVEVHYREVFNIFLPPDGSSKPTEEEQARFDAGEINIGYGSDTREEETFYMTKWVQDDIYYSITTFDPGDLTQEDFLQMAAEVINAQPIA